MRTFSWQKPVTAAILMASALSLSACGTTPGDRMLSGGLLGSGAGALIGSVTGSAGKGALIGGVAGAALGGLTKPSDVYLGEPPWNHSSSYHHYSSYHHTTHSTCTTHYTDTQRVTTCPR
jgi:hypothetical protein